MTYRHAYLEKLVYKEKKTVIKTDLAVKSSKNPTLGRTIFTGISWTLDAWTLDA